MRSMSMPPSGVRSGAASYTAVPAMCMWLVGLSVSRNELSRNPSRSYPTLAMRCLLSVDLLHAVRRRREGPPGLWLRRVGPPRALGLCQPVRDREQHGRMVAHAAVRAPYREVLRARARVVDAAAPRDDAVGLAVEGRGRYGQRRPE